MTVKRFFSIKSFIGWLFLVYFFLLVVMAPLYTNTYTKYTAKSQLTGAHWHAMLASGYVSDFYKEHHYFPQLIEVSQIVSSMARHVETVIFTNKKESDFLYVVIKMKSDFNVDKRVRGKSIVVVMEPAFKWQYKVNCQTNLNEILADCSR